MTNPKTVGQYNKSVQRQKQAYDYFISQGYSPAAASGIVGNLVYESGLNTTIEGDKGFKGGSSYGIAQFRGERLKRLKERYGNNWTDFNNQLDFVNYELQTTHKKAGEILKNTTNVYEAGQAFSDYYEIPAKKYKDNKDRQQKVNSIFSTFVGQESPIITQEVSNFETPVEIPTFANTQPFVALETTPETQKPQENPKVEEAKQMLSQKQSEEDLINYLTSQQRSQQTIEQTTQPYRPINILDTYNQVTQFVETPLMKNGGQIPVSKLGVFETGANPVIVPSPSITMQGVEFPILAVADTGEQKILRPDLNYYFTGANNVLEIPLI